MADGRAAASRGAYRAAGVDVEAGERAVELMKGHVASTHRPEVVGGLGGFGGAFGIPAGYREPLLIASSDGVGTKTAIASSVGRFDTIGIDLVAMCADDVVCTGAEPLFFLDYISTGSVDPARMADLVSGVAEGCRQVGATLLGGEMAEHAGIMSADEFDLVGFAVGVVERDEVLGPQRVVAGDVLLGLPSPGLRSNGYTLARHVLLERAGRDYTDPAWPGADSTVADELLLPSVIYTPAVRAAVAAADVHAVAHVTGGGFEGNVPRALPEGCRAVLVRGSWDIPPIFTEIRRLGRVDDEEMARVFNLGLGMVVSVSADTVDEAVTALSGAGVDPVVVGWVEEGERGVELTGPPLWPNG